MRTWTPVYRTGRQSRNILSICRTGSKRYTGTVQEIERKFIVTPAVYNTCRAMATSDRELFMVDTYYDSPTTFRLTKQDMWLRERNQSWELKVPSQTVTAAGDAALQVDHYDEITNEQEIANVVCTTAAQKIEVDSTVEGGHLLAAIANEGIVPFARLTTKRHRFRVQLPGIGSGRVEVNVDIDTVTCDSTLINHPHQAQEASRWKYEVGEVELVTVNGATSIADASTVMQDVMRALGINPVSVNGKVLQYLQQFRVRHYTALDETGLLKAKGLKR